MNNTMTLNIKLSKRAFLEISPGVSQAISWLSYWQIKPTTPKINTRNPNNDKTVLHNKPIITNIFVDASVELELNVINVGYSHDKRHIWMSNNETWDFLMDMQDMQKTKCSQITTTCTLHSAHKWQTLVADNTQHTDFSVSYDFARFRFSCKILQDSTVQHRQ